VYVPDVADRIDGEAFIAPTFGQRLGGRLLDSVILLPVVVVPALTTSALVTRVVVFAIVAVYEIAGVALWGQTLGKHAVGTRVVSTDSDALRPAQAVVRFACYGGGAFVLSAIGAGLVGELWTLLVILPVLRPPLHRGLHDCAAHTIVTPTRTWSMREPPPLDAR
jgi:uncharacterized RDD family membrane protein YckC